MEKIASDFLNSFNISHVTSSLSAFVSSGYVFIILIVLFVLGLVKKAVKLLLTCVVAFGVWYFFFSGHGDAIFAGIEQKMNFIVSAIH